MRRMVDGDLVNLLKMDFKQVEFLSAEEERIKVLEAQGGSTKALDVLTTSNMPWILSECKKYIGFDDIRFLDCVNEGFLGFCESVMRFDVTRNCRLKTYAKFWVDRYIYKFVVSDHLVAVPFSTLQSCNNKKSKKLQRRIKAAMNVIRINGRAFDIPDYRESNFEKVECLDKMSQFIGTLPDKQRFILTRKLEGVSDGEIGRELGVTRQRVHQIYSKAIEKLRDLMQDE